MKVSELIQGNALVVKVVGSMETQVKMLTADSRKAEGVEGGLFFCISGANFDGHKFAAQMVEKGCSVIVGEREVPEAACTQQSFEHDGSVPSTLPEISPAHRHFRIPPASVSPDPGRPYGEETSPG